MPVFPVPSPPVHPDNRHAGSPQRRHTGNSGCSVGIAERRGNPKRRFCLSAKRWAAISRPSWKSCVVFHRRLSEQFPQDLPQPLLVIGMAETAVGLGAGVYSEIRPSVSGILYLSSTGHPADGELL